MRKKSIKTELLLAFIVIALLPIAIISQCIYTTFYNAHIEDILSNLNKIADKKVEQINNYSQERLKDVQLLAASPKIHDDIQQLLTAFYQQGISSKAYQKLNKNAYDTYADMVKIGGYYDVILISKNGDVVFSIKHQADSGTNLRTGIFKDSELTRVFDNATRLLSSDFSSYRDYPPSKENAAFVAAPILKNQQVIGVVALQINSRDFQQVVQDNMSLGDTAETVVARLAGQQGHFLFPLKYKASQVNNNLINLNAKVGLPIQNALKGENSAGISTDYRGHQVIASWRYIPSTQMGMVVKIDIEEALRGFHKVQWLQSVFLLVIVICVSLSGLYLRWFLLDPINELLLTTKKIAKGDLSQRAPIKDSDEIGRLAQAFNLMVDNLQKAQNTLEREVQERTLNLKAVNNLLTEQILKHEKISKQLEQTLAFQQAILNSNNFSIISTNQDGIILSFNAAAEKLLGYQADELINQHTPSLFHDAEEVVARAKQLTQELKRPVKAGFAVFVEKTDQGADENEWTYIRKDGGRFPVWLSVTAILNEEREKIGYLGIASDITERKRTADELLLAYKAIEHINEGIMITNGKNIITHVNPAYTRIMGYAREEVIGKNPGFSKSGRHDKKFYQAMWAKIHTEGTWEGELWDRRKDGAVFPKWLSINTIKDYQGKIAHHVGIFMNISHQKATEEKLERLAFYDPLTQLPNRALFRERLNQELLAVNRNNGQTALFFIDLDRFKWVNDNLGHDVGDDLLIAVAARITEEIRETDSACRLGGDEFTVILSNLIQMN